MKEKHCPTCTCGRTRCYWSDRDGYIDPHDRDDVLEMVESCAFDHYYDRSDDGVPYFDEFEWEDKFHKLLGPIVMKHLEIMCPIWKDKTVNPTKEQRANMRKEMEEAWDRV